MNPCDTLAANLKNKTHLVRLSLDWNLKQNNDDSIKEREVLENLQPSIHLKHLSVDGYGGTQFPRWLSDNSLLNVVSLILTHCKRCLWLPSLGLLTFLKHLTIVGLDWIRRIDADFYGNSSSAFVSLEMLQIINMKECEEWTCMTGAFPSLQRLYVKNCPKLKGHLPEHLSQLKELVIGGCEQLVASNVSLDLHVYSCLCIDIPINHCYDFLAQLIITQCCDSLVNFPLDLFPTLYNLCLNLTKYGHIHRK